jgi:hypothetical protein
MLTRRRGRLLAAAIAVAVLLGLAVDSASAGRLSVSSTRFRIWWVILEVAADNEAESPFLRCQVTLEGSFHSATIRKVTGALIGAITRGAVNNETCVNGKASVLQESLPWHFTYEGFEGMLPNISNVKVLLNRYAVRTEFPAFGISCLYREFGRPEENLLFRLNRTVSGEITTMVPDPGRHIARSAGQSIFCPIYAKVAGVGQVFVLGTTTPITITLI